ncbi:MAG: peptidyl-prolyl cis-trans isomerase [Phycisphaerae bacterium]
MSLRKMSLLVSFVLSVLMLSVATEGKENAGGKGKNKPASAVKPTTSAPSTVMATMGNKKLTYGELQSFKKFFAPGAEDERMISIWKVNTALAEKARKEKIDRDPEIKGIFGMACDQILVNMMMRKKQLDATVTDAEVKEYCEKNKDNPEFREPALITAKIIAAESKEEADKIKKQLVEGTDFDKLSEKYRSQTLKATGLSDIEIKKMAVNNLVQTLGMAAYGMNGANLNEVIGPRQATKGWVLFKVTARSLGNPIPLEKLTPDIRSQLLSAKQRAVQQEIIKEGEKIAGVTLQLTPPRGGMGPRGMRPMPPVTK